MMDKTKARNTAYEERLGTDRMLPLVLRMALPSVAAQIVNLLYNLVDRIYIGHIPGIGTHALAGIGVTGSVIILISAFSAIVSGGGAPLAAIALGQGDRKRAGQTLGNGFVLLLIFTLLTTSLTYIFMEPLLLLTGASENTVGYAKTTSPSTSWAPSLSRPPSDSTPSSTPRGVRPSPCTRCSSVPFSTSYLTRSSSSSWEWVSRVRHWQRSSRRHAAHAGSSVSSLRNGPRSSWSSDTCALTETCSPTSLP